MDPLVEVRRFTKGFLHGKAYIADHPTMPAVLAGSSNLTLAGLSWNRELNLVTLPVSTLVSSSTGSTSSGKSPPRSI